MSNNLNNNCDIVIPTPTPLMLHTDHQHNSPIFLKMIYTVLLMSQLMLHHFLLRYSNFFTINNTSYHYDNQSNTRMRGEDDNVYDAVPNVSVLLYH